MTEKSINNLLIVIEALCSIEDDDIFINEFKLPEELDGSDYKKYSNLLKKANDILDDNGGKPRQETLVNIIMDVLKMTINLASKLVVGVGLGVVLPKSTNINILTIDRKDSPPLKVNINPVQYILDTILSALINKLIEISVTPVRVKYMVKSYKNMIKDLERIKSTCRDDKVEEQCNILIDKINKAIKELESKIKEDPKMKTLQEMMEEIENNDTEINMSYIDLDDLISTVESTIEEIEEGCNKKTCKVDESRKSSKKEEGDVDNEDDDPDVEPENESVIDIDINDIF